ncbi:hypothetical protein KAI46_16500 [bacterium]|nr:hypothetical protein [bacterium]
MKVLSRQWLQLLAAVMFLFIFGAGSAFADYAYYFPYFSSSDTKGEAIGLALTNVGNGPATVKIAIMDQDGVTKTVETWNLALFGQKAAVIGADQDAVEGSFQVLSDKPLTGLAFLFAHHMQVMYDLPMTQTPANKLDIPHAAQDDSWGMRILVSNPEAQPAVVSLQYRAGDGTGVASPYVVNIKAYGSTVISVADLLVGWGLSALSGGCLHLVSEGSGLVAFATYDDLNGDGTFYAGLGAVDPVLQQNNFNPTRLQYAVVSCSAPDFSSGVHALLEVEKPRSVQDNLLPASSDIRMAAQGNFFYRLARYNGDSLTKFAASAPATPIWQYSTMDANDVMATSNPQSLIFAPATLASGAKAYIPRYESTKMWVVDLATTTQENFKIGEVELGDYADADGKPEMTQGVVVDGKLFLLLQRLDKEDGWAPQTAYLVVIDTDTNEEIDTQSPAGVNFKGIPLPIKNPQDIVYKNGKIYVSGVGSYASAWNGTPADYSGGIAVVDPVTYAVEMLVDDGDDNEHPYGNITFMTVVSANRGYFVSYADWGDTALYGFNPTTGVVDELPLNAFPFTESALDNSNVTTLGVDGSGMLWVASNSTLGGGILTIINPVDDSVDQVQTLTLNPQGIAFGDWD